MKKKIVLGILLTLLLTSLSTVAFSIQRITAEPATWTVDDDGPADFSSIQDAINSLLVTDGDTIFVHSGTYYEHVVIHKAVSLIGEEKEATIIDGGDVGTVVLVTASNVFIGGFTIRRSGEPNVGIAVVWAQNNTITGNTISHNQFGIWLNFSDTNEISGNVVANNVWDGIFLLGSRHNTATRNTIFGCARGIRLEGSDHNLVKRNNVTANHTGLAIGLSDNDTVTENTFSDCLYGTSLFKAGQNRIYHNNFINNPDPASADRSDDNSWDDGYPSGGNYWSNHVPVDDYCGVNQDEPGSDGIADASYIIDADNRDRYPLVHPWAPISWEHVFEDARRGTILKISTDDKQFQFSAPERAFSVKHDPDMTATAHFLALRFGDDELRLLSCAIMMSRGSFCLAVARDGETGTRYLLVDLPVVRPVEPPRVH